MRTVRKWAGLIALALTLTAMAAAPAAAAATGTGPGAARVASNPPCGTWQTKYNTFADGYEGETWFTINTAGCAQHVALKCRDRFGTTKWINPPWVVGLYVHSGANCPATWNPTQLNLDIAPPTYGSDGVWYYVVYRY